LKAIVCEICQSNDLVKQEGLFVCQHCGTKYSPEDARKLMIDGPVEVTGAVRIDNSANLDKALKNARRARDDSNDELAAKYYLEVIDLDPDNWEAIFYNTYFTSMQCKIGQISSAAISINNCVDTVLKLIKNHVYEESEKETAVTEMVTRTIQISTMLYRAATNHYNGIDLQIQANYNQEYINNVSATYNTMYFLGEQLEGIFGDKGYATSLAVEAWKTGIAWHNSVMNLFADKKINKDLILRYAEKISKYDSTYQAPNVNTGGCYIATAVYGSYNCYNVLVLRRYRDNVLANKWYGRVFIYLYYVTSPTIVKLFKDTTWFNVIIKKKLDIIVNRLNNNDT
jgi:hypothetical protein